MNLEPKYFSLAPSKSQKIENDYQMENGDNQRNPLDIPEILSIVAGYIDKIEDLKKVRLLNRKWKDETFKKWRNTAVFLINSETKPVLLKAFDKVGYDDLSDAEKEKLQTEKDPFLFLKFPFKNYRFQSGISPRGAHDLEDAIMKEVIAPNADYLDIIGQCEISGCQLNGQDQLENIFRNNLNVTELALMPLIKKGPASYNRNRYLQSKPAKALNLRKLNLSPPPQPNKNSRNISNFQGELEFNGEDESAYRVLIRRMPNLKALHETSGNVTYNMLAAMTRVVTRNEIVIKLEEITVLATQVMPLSHEIANYFRVVRPPLRVLKVPVAWIECVKKSNFIQSLRVVQDTIAKLKLEVDCAVEWSNQLAMPIQGEADFHLNGRYFPNLTHFKVVMDFEMGFVGKMISFDLNHLRKMPKVKEFFFGFKNDEVIPEGVAEIKIEISEDAPSWINEDNDFAPENDALSNGIHFDQILKDEVEGDGLRDLKSFHFSRNLTKASLQLLAKWTKNLQTLEMVFDEDSFSVVGECWPRLQNLILLRGSKRSGENYFLDLLSSFKGRQTKC